MNVDPRFLQLGLILAALLVLAVLSLLWLVGSVSRVVQPRPDGRPAAGSGEPLTLRLGPRTVGALAVLLSLVCVAWAWHDAQALGRSPVKLAFLGPFLLCVGLWSIVEGPDLRSRRLTPLGWAFSAAGILLGILYISILRSAHLPPFPWKF